jgi:hypothetical protein
MDIEKQILDFLKSNPESSSNRILENIEEKKSIATIKRILSFIKTYIRDTVLKSKFIYNKFI